MAAGSKVLAGPVEGEKPRKAGCKEARKESGCSLKANGEFLMDLIGGHTHILQKDSVSYGRCRRQDTGGDKRKLK